MAFGQLVKFAKGLPPPLRHVAAILYRPLARAGFALASPYYRMRRKARRAGLPALAQNKKPLILFLAPEAGLTQFYMGHALLAKTLTESGHQVLVMSCQGTSAMCSLKSALGPHNSHKDTCNSCRSAALILGEKYGLPDVSLESMTSENERAEIRALVASSGDAPWTILHDGIAFGELALGETLRNRRKLEIEDLDAGDRAQLVATLTAGLQNYVAVKNLAARYNVRRLVYYGAYAYWLPIVVFARKAGIPATQIEHGYNRDIDMRLLNLRPDPVHVQQATQVAHWDEYRDIPLDPQVTALIVESGLYRLSNHGRRSTHSPNFVRRDHNILADFGLPSTRKTLVAYSSSADEFLAARHILHALGHPYGDGPQPFEDSNGWLKALVDWVGAQDDIQLILRLHPRLSAPQGHKPAAEELALRSLLSAVPDNIRIVWPQDKVSSYNLAEVADVALVSWSTIGLELARFGVPVIASFPDRGSFPVGTFIGFEETPERYFAAIRSALGRSASHEMIAEAMRWTHFLFLSPTVDLSESVPEFDFQGVPEWVMPAEKERIIRSLVGGEDASKMRMDGLARDTRARAAEHAALQLAIECIIIFFMTGKDTANGRISRIDALGENLVVLTYDGQIYRHVSPLAHRLAVLWNSATAASNPSTADA